MKKSVNTLSNQYVKDKRMTPAEQRTDHKGNTFSTIKEMCEHYGVKMQVFYARKSRGWETKECLEGKKKKKVKKKKQIVDHKGNTFATKNAMYERYDVKRQEFYNRKKRGWTLEECLEGKTHTNDTIEYNKVKFKDKYDFCRYYGINLYDFIEKKNSGCTLEQIIKSCSNKENVTDYKGEVYPTEYAMCKRYGIPPALYTIRISSGWTMKHALNTKYNSTRFRRTICNEKKIGIRRSNIAYKDHKDNVFPTMSAMCEHYGITPAKFINRLEKGWDLGAVLEGYWLTDNKGNKYRSEREMCEKNGVNYSNFLVNINSGYSLSEALKSRKKDLSVKAPNGKTYNSMKDLCKDYGISYNKFLILKKKGLSVEKCIKEAQTKKVKEVVKDHLGNEYTSISAMCKHYGISADTYHRKLRNGESLEAIFSGDNKRNGVTDHKGNHFNTVKEMCAHYDVPVATYNARRRLGFSDEEIFETNKPKRKRKRRTKE